MFIIDVLFVDHKGFVRAFTSSTLLCAENPEIRVGLWPYKVHHGPNKETVQLRGHWSACPKRRLCLLIGTRIRQPALRSQYSFTRSIFLEMAMGYNEPIPSQQMSQGILQVDINAHEIKLENAVDSKRWKCVKIDENIALSSFHSNQTDSSKKQACNDKRLCTTWWNTVYIHRQGIQRLCAETAGCKEESDTSLIKSWQNRSWQSTSGFLLDWRNELMASLTCPGSSTECTALRTGVYQSILNPQPKGCCSKTKADEFGWRSNQHLFSSIFPCCLTDHPWSYKGIWADRLQLHLLAVAARDPFQLWRPQSNELRTSRTAPL